MVRKSTVAAVAALALSVSVLLAARPRGAIVPSEPQLSTAARLYGLALLWQEANYNFAFFDEVPDLDWDASYREFIPQVLSAEGLLEYYRTLQRFVALLGDGHTRVDLPRSLVDQRSLDAPWIGLRAIGRRAVVVNVGVSLANSVPIGSEVLEVDGRRIGPYLRERVFPYVAASSEDARWRLGVRGSVSRGFGLLVGAAGTSLRLAVLTPSGARRELVVRRTRSTDGDRWVRPPPDRLLEFRWLPNDVAYVALNSFNDDRLVAQFDSVLPELLRADALVLDVRRNGGGRDAVVRAILSRLTERTLVGPAWRTRVHNAAFKAWGRFADREEWAERYEPYYRGDAWYDGSPDTLVPPEGPKVTVPIVALIGDRTESSAENFLVYLDGEPRCVFVGSPTIGSTGQPLFLDLPGGGRAWIATKRNRFPDGRDYVGVGIQPDELVVPTPDDVAAGRDAALERALEMLAARD